MYINKSKKIVIKVGSSILIDKKGKPKRTWLKEFIQDIKFLIKKKKQVVIVSSGAIALGCKYLGIQKKGLKIDKSQAVASIGQIELMGFYKKVFEKSKIKISQILLTLDDTEQRRRSINARRTIDNLLAMGIVPIVNENDTTATTEIKYGDNDRLAASLSLSPYFISVVAVVSFSLTMGTIPIVSKLSIVLLAFIDLLLCSVSSSVSNICEIFILFSSKVFL